MGGRTGLRTHLGRSAAEDRSGQVFWSAASARSRAQAPKGRARRGINLNGDGFESPAPPIGLSPRAREKWPRKRDGDMPQLRSRRSRKLTQGRMRCSVFVKRRRSAHAARREPATSRNSAESFWRLGSKSRGRNCERPNPSPRAMKLRQSEPRRRSARSKCASPSLGLLDSEGRPYATRRAGSAQRSVEQTRRGIGRRRLALFLSRLRGRFFLGSYRDPAPPVRRNGSPNTVMANQSRGSRLKVSRTASLAAKQAVIASSPAFQRSIKAGSQR